MTDFIHDDFLLKTATARRLYHEFAEGLPIIDYHKHAVGCDNARSWLIPKDSTIGQEMHKWQ